MAESHKGLLVLKYFGILDPERMAGLRESMKGPLAEAGLVAFVVDEGAKWEIYVATDPTASERAACES